MQVSRGGAGGSYIVPSLILAISEKSECKDGAWEFISYYLSDDYQNSNEMYDLPLSIKAFDRMLDEAQKKMSYMDENGNEVEYDEYYYFNNTEEIITPITAERTQEFRDYIFSIDKCRCADTTVLKIVEEEAEAFFAGAKSAKEVAEIIQNRVWIYINENR